MTYQFRGFHIPDYIMEGIKRYIDYGLPPGSFLTAIVENDLKGAVESADDNNLENIPAFVAYFYNEAPANCWGSPEIVSTWICRGGLKGEQDG